MRCACCVCNVKICGVLYVWHTWHVHACFVARVGQGVPAAFLLQVAVVAAILALAGKAPPTSYGSCLLFLVLHWTVAMGDAPILLPVFPG